MKADDFTQQQNDLHKRLVSAIKKVFCRIPDGFEPEIYPEAPPVIQSFDDTISEVAWRITPDGVDVDTNSNYDYFLVWENIKTDVLIDILAAIQDFEWEPTSD